MRISDWSSDVCSSDLAVLDSDAFRALPDAGKVAILALCRNHNGANNGRIALTRTDAVRWRLDKRRRRAGLDAAEAAGLIECTARGKSACPGPRATTDMFRLLLDRQGVVQGTTVSVRVVIGGRRVIQKKR